MKKILCERCEEEMEICTGLDITRFNNKKKKYFSYILYECKKCGWSTYVKQEDIEDEVCRQSER